MSEREVIRRVIAGETALFEILMRRYNQRLYRVARSVVKDDSEAEDVLQQAYVNAFAHLDQFEERSRFSTWMTRITLNEAFARRRAFRRLEPVAADPEELDPKKERAMEAFRIGPPDPERQAYAAELRHLLERAVDSLPEGYRSVFVLRDVEGLSTHDASEGLGLSEEAVRTRLHRARALVRRAVTEHLGPVAAGAFEFPAHRCDRVVNAVMARLETKRSSTSIPSP